jgi:hypothetical protein
VHLALSDGECQPTEHVRTVRCEVKGSLALSSHECQFGRSSTARVRAFSSRVLMPMTGAMRTQGFRTHICLVLAGAAVVIASLQRPWYARAPRPRPDEVARIGDVNGPLNGLFKGMQRWVTEAGGQTGWHALDVVGQVVAGLAGFAALAAVGCMLGDVQRHVAEPLRYTATATFGLVAWKLVDPPGANGVWELRSGALIAAAGAVMLAVSAQSVASAPSRKRAARVRYVAPPPPPAYEPTSSSSPPPGL